MSAEGVKYDAEKPQVNLIHPAFLVELAKLATFGAQKYDAHNWELGMDWHRPYNAMMRHALKWAMGEQMDPEGFPHLIAVAWNAMVLWTYQQYGIAKDTVHVNPTRGSFAVAKVEADS